MVTVILFHWTTGQERFANPGIWRADSRAEAEKGGIGTESECLGMAAWKYETEVRTSGNKSQTRD